MDEKIFLGVHKEMGLTYLTKHKWECNWYWAFGYLGNRDCHWRISQIIDHPENPDAYWTEISHHFKETWLTQKQWWILRDLFIIAYGLKKAAEIYRHGGYQIAEARPYGVENTFMVTVVNKDLKVVLDNIWTLLNKWQGEYELANNIEKSKDNGSGI